MKKNINKFEPLEIKGNLKNFIIIILLGVIIFYDEIDILYNNFVYLIIIILLFVNYMLLKNNIGIIFLLSIIYCLITINKIKNKKNKN
jgi:hypothetical protein